MLSKLGIRFASVNAVAVVKVVNVFKLVVVVGNAVIGLAVLGVLQKTETESLDCQHFSKEVLKIELGSK